MYIYRYLLAVLAVASFSVSVDAAEHSVGTPLAEGEYVTAQNGHLSYGGERLRLWGTNFVRFVKREGNDLELSMDRIVDAGFNAIRLNLFETTFIPEYKEKGFFVPDTVKGSGSYIDRLDHTVALGKERGLLFWFSFDIDRKIRLSDYDVLPDDGTRAEWEEMVKVGRFKNLVYFDPRSEKIFEDFAESLLNHVNPYTGKRYADEEAIALWEISNENDFVDFITAAEPEGLARKLLTERWNDWLLKRYGSDDGLLAAWGRLPEGESLAVGNVAYAPLRNAQRVEDAGAQFQYVSKDDPDTVYPQKRGEDLIRFAVDLYLNHTRRFTEFVRSVGEPGKGISVVPITPTGRYGTSWPMYYAASQGDFVSVGLYSFSYRPWSVDKESANYPHVVRLNEPPMMEMPIDVLRVKGKPFLVYECGDYRPNPFTVEFPIRMATHAIKNNTDGVFWFYWDDTGYLKDLASDADYARLPMPMPHYEYGNAGLVHGNDEVQLAALKAAANLYLNAAIAPAANPVQAQIGGDRIFSTVGDGFSDLLGYKALRGYAWRDGLQITYEPDQATVLPAKGEGAERSVEIAGGIVADWSDGRGFMRMDVPTAKVYVGFNGDGFAFGDLQVMNASREWLWFSLSAKDGLPLEKSQEVLLTLVSRSENEGMLHDPERYDGGWYRGLGRSVVRPGGMPVVERVGAEMSATWLRGKWIHRYDFQRNLYSSQRIPEDGAGAGVIVISEDEPLFYAIVTDSEQAPDVGRFSLRR